MGASIKITLRLLQQMMRDEMPERLRSTSHMQEGFELLRSYPSIGNFLAYQLITDLKLQHSRRLQ